MKVLIVDDTEANRKLLRVTLEAEGIETCEAADGIKALSALQHEKVDAIISDILMPNMDGYSLCQAVRRNEEIGDVPFIFYTNTYTTPGDEKLALDCGADLYIKKPTPISEILNALRALHDPLRGRETISLRPPDEAIVMKEYSEALVRKLEERNISLQRAHAEIAKANEELEQRALELSRARDAAEGASRAKSEFLTMMSHEIRTPMNGLMGMLDLVLQDEISPKLAESFKLVKRSAAALMKLLNEILVFSKMDAAIEDGNVANFSLHQCIAHHLAASEHDAVSSGMVVNRCIAPEVPDSLIGDERSLGKILANLVDNAVKFSRKRGKIVLSIGVDSRAKGEVCLHFSVSDWGIGIAPENQELIFDSFTQIDSSATRAFEGAGLGLAIVRKLAGAMGGHVWVESGRGSGSTFHFVARFRTGDAGIFDTKTAQS